MVKDKWPLDRGSPLNLSSILSLDEIKEYRKVLKDLSSILIDSKDNLYVCISAKRVCATWMSTFVHRGGI